MLQTVLGTKGLQVPRQGDHPHENGPKCTHWVGTAQMRCMVGRCSEKSPKGELGLNVGRDKGREKEGQDNMPNAQN